MRRALWATLALTLVGCAGVETTGLGVAEPEVGRYTLESYAAYVDVDSLRPRFRWEPLPLERLDPGVDVAARVRDVTYELRIWEERELGAALVLRRDGITGTEFRPEQDLAPDARHLWSVRAWFLFDGKRRATDWALAGKPLQHEAVPNLSCLRFQTPAR